MGNNMGGGAGGGKGSGKSAKVMKINGEYFKVKTPIIVFDVIKDYPDHVLLDSEEFMRFNLRAKPLTPDYELKPRKIYLLVEFPKFPTTKQSPLRKVRSGVLTTTPPKKVYRRSVSDDLRSTVDRRLDGLVGVGVGPTRVKMRLPKSQVQRIMQENGDDNVEVAKKILDLRSHRNAVVSTVEERECGDEGAVKRNCYRSKYEKLLTP